jgi:hypothetical protein
MKYSWQFIKDHIHNNTNTFVFERSDRVRLEHSKNRAIVRNEYVLPGDHIKIDYMNWMPFKNTHGKIFAVRQSVSVDSIILKNTFPYNLRKGIQHYNLFSVKPLSSDEVNIRLREFIGNRKKFMWFVNHPTIQSIPDLWHCHFFYIQND